MIFSTDCEKEQIHLVLGLKQIRSWLLHMGPQAEKVTPSQTSAKCYAFNFSGFGCKQQCDSSHLCKRCNFDQPMPVCPKLKVSTQQPPSCPVNFRPKPNLSAYPKKRYGEPGTNIIPRQPFPVPSAPQQVQGYGAVAKPQSNKKFKIGIYRGIQTKEAAKLLSDGFYFRFNLC